MKKQLVYDLPTRAFHWIFSGLFLAAFTIAKTMDAESSIYSYHMMAGLTLLFALCMRIIWGVVGTRHARFQDFDLRPKRVVKYFQSIIKNEKILWAGHNPASSWAAILMMLLALGLGITGIWMASGGDKEILEEVHEVLANSFFVVAAFHVMGIVVHTLRFKELIGLSMLTGKKENVPDNESIPLPRTGLGVIFIALTVAFTVHLLKHYEPSTKQLELFGFSLQLGEISKNDNHGEDD